MLSDKKIQQFNSLIKNNELDQALHLANNLNQKHPQNETTYNMLGSVFLKKNEYDNAILCYQASLTLAPEQTNILLLLGKVFDLNGGEPALRFDVFSKALALEPDNTNVLCRVGEFLSSQGHFNDAFALLDKALALGDKTALSHSLGLFERQGDKQAIKDLFNKYSDYFQKQISKDEAFETIKALYYIKDYSTVLNELLTLNTENQTPSWLSLYYKILGDTYEKLKDHQNAFSSYEKMNQFITIAYHPDYYENLSLTCQKLAKDIATTKITQTNIEPIFIVGMPRTGTSLIEKVINTVNQVSAGGELYLIDNLFVKITNSQSIESSINDYYQQLQNIADQTNNNETQFITDKMPTNFFFIGLIKKLFPNAKIIYTHRNAIDTGMSIYKQMFPAQITYATNLKNIAHFLSIERKLMTHWLEQYPDILSINFETFLQDFKPQSQRLFNYLGFEWTEQVTEFYKQKDFTNTASSDQVKQPINSTVIGQYEAYKPFLEDFTKYLEEYGIS